MNIYVKSIESTNIWEVQSWTMRLLDNIQNGSHRLIEAKNYENRQTVIVYSGTFEIF